MLNHAHNSPRSSWSNIGEGTETQLGNSFVSCVQVVKRRARESAEWLPKLLSFFCQSPSLKSLSAQLLAFQLAGTPQHLYVCLAGPEVRQPLWESGPQRGVFWEAPCNLVHKL